MSAVCVPRIPGWRHLSSGKVRDLYVPAGRADAGSEHADYLLVVASDRVSAFDRQLTPSIPGKGALLTALTTWWFALLEQHQVVQHHLVRSGNVATDAMRHGSDTLALPPIPVELADRAMLTRRLRMHPIECVVRGALTGSGYREYRETGGVCGIELPKGIGDGDLLDEPIYTPAHKASQGTHDVNVTFEGSAALVGREVATALRDTSLRLFAAARNRAAERGFVLADTKFEFGWDPRAGTAAELVLADEVLTGDSSRYWDAVNYANRTLCRADRLASFDKQMVRDWLAAHWDGHGTPPQLPAEVVAGTWYRYRELFVRLTGRTWPRAEAEQPVVAQTP